MSPASHLDILLERDQACTLSFQKVPSLQCSAVIFFSHAAGAKRSAPEAANGDESDAQKKPRLQNGAAAFSEAEALDSAMRNGSIESSRAMASGAVAEAETAVKVVATSFSFSAAASRWRHAPNHMKCQYTQSQRSLPCQHQPWMASSNVSPAMITPLARLCKACCVTAAMRSALSPAPCVSVRGSSSCPPKHSTSHVRS